MIINTIDDEVRPEFFDFDKFNELTILKAIFFKEPFMIVLFMIFIFVDLQVIVFFCVYFVVKHDYKLLIHYTDVFNNKKKKAQGSFMNFIHCYTFEVSYSSRFIDSSIILRSHFTMTTKFVRHTHT